MTYLPQVWPSVLVFPPTETSSTSLPLLLPMALLKVSARDNKHIMYFNYKIRHFCSNAVLSLWRVYVRKTEDMSSSYPDLFCFKVQPWTHSAGPALWNAISLFTLHGGMKCLFFFFFKWNLLSYFQPNASKCWVCKMNFNWVHPTRMKTCPRLERTAKFGVMASAGEKVVPQQSLTWTLEVISFCL